MKTMKFRIEGMTPLVMHNIRLANPLDPIVQRIAKITRKKAREKTIQDAIDIARLEFEGGLYWDKDKKIGPYIPGMNLQAAIVEAARLTRKGSLVERSMLVQDEKIKLEYEGPRDVEQLWDARSKDGTQLFADIRGMKPTGRGVVQRCRPKFVPPWSAEFTVEFDENQLDPEAVEGLLRQAGLVTGLMDDRPRGGRFTTEVVDG